MAFSPTNDMVLAYIAETVPGTTPATPAFQKLLMTSDSFARNKQTSTDNSIRADGNINSILDHGYQVSGNIQGHYVDGPLEALLEGVFRSTWATDSMTNGVTDKSWTFERYLNANNYHRYEGCKLGGITLAMPSKGDITFDIPVVGMSTSESSEVISGATYTAAAAAQALSSSTATGLFELGDVAYDATNISLAITTNARAQEAVGAPGARGVAHNRMQVNITADIYFQTAALYTAFKDHTDVKFELQLGQTTGEKVKFTVPKTKILTGAVPAPGVDQDFMLNLTMQGVYDSGIDGTIQVDRNIA